jgi:hypothetical protein
LCLARSGDPGEGLGDGFEDAQESRPGIGGRTEDIAGGLADIPEGGEELNGQRHRLFDGSLKIAGLECPGHSL